MGLTIELSFDLNTVKNVSEMQNKLDNIVYYYEPIQNYFFYETTGGRKIERNDCIQTVELELNKNIINYIKEILKIKSIKIDCIYLNDNQIDYIYISKKYIINNYLINVKSINNNISNVIKIIDNVLKKQN